MHERSKKVCGTEVGHACFNYTYVQIALPGTQLKENILVCAQVCYGHRFQAVQEVPVYLLLNIP